MKKKTILYLVIVLLISASIAVIIFNESLKTSNIQIPSNGVLQLKSINNNIILLGDSCSKDYVNKKADYIIEGTISNIEESWNANHTSHAINANFQIEKFVRGKPLDISKIEIIDIMNFDKPADINKTISGRPVFRGGKTRLYLVETQGRLFTLCGTYGIEAMF